jgi:hypothetical protein
MMCHTEEKAGISHVNQLLAVLQRGKGLLKEYGFEVLEQRIGRPRIFEELKELVPMADAVMAGMSTTRRRSTSSKSVTVPRAVCQQR